MLGAIILTEITTLLVANNFSAAIQQALLGVVILLVVATYGRERPVRHGCEPARSAHPAAVR